MKRLQFLETSEFVEEMDRLKDRAKCRTRAELFRRAVRSFAWILRYKRGGYVIQAVREGERPIRLEFPG